MSPADGLSTATVTTLLQGNLLDSDQGGIAFCAVVLIEAGGQRIIVDPGSSGRNSALRASLAGHGLTPADISTVVLTHAHWDHMQNIDMFGHAAVLLHPAELSYLAHPHPGDFATPGWAHAALAQYNVRPVEGGSEVAPGVRVLAVPGHSPATIAVTAETASGTAVIAGDAVQSAQVAMHGRNALVFWDEAQATRSVAAVIEAADVIYPGHDCAFRLTGGGAPQYTEKRVLSVTGLDLTDPGIAVRPASGFRPAVHQQAAGWSPVRPAAGQAG